MWVGLLLLAAALVWQFTATIAAGAPGQGAWTESSILIGGLRRWYRIYRPAHLPKGAATVVLLHGGTQSMRKIFNSRAGGPAPGWRSPIATGSCCWCPMV